MVLAKQLFAVTIRRRAIFLAIVLFAAMTTLLTLALKAQNRSVRALTADNTTATPEQAPNKPQTVHVSTSSSSNADSAPQPPITSNTSSTNASVTVNGQTIPVPENGSTQQTITSDDNHSAVDVNVQNSSTGTTRKRNSTTVQINSRSVDKVSERRSISQTSN
jgi:hypothetical protein